MSLNIKKGLLETYYKELSVISCVKTFYVKEDLLIPRLHECICWNLN